MKKNIKSFNIKSFNIKSFKIRSFKIRSFKIRSFKIKWLLKTVMIVSLTCTYIAKSSESDSANQFSSTPNNIKQMLFQGNYLQAAVQLKLLSKEGQAVAQYQLALLYLAGNGVSISESKAKNLLIKSAESYPKSAYLLATLYLKKEPTKIERQRAIQYLEMASHAGNRQATKKLTEINSKLSGKQFRPQTQAFFELALSSGNLSSVIKQYLKGANLDRKNDKGDYPIATSIKYNRSHITRWLLKQKINLNSIDRLKNTPLHLLAKSGELALIIQFSEKLGSLDRVNSNGETAILIALINGHIQTAQWLIDNGANANVINNKGLSAVSYAQRNKIILSKRINKSNKQKNKIAESRKKQQQTYSIKQLTLLSEKKDSSYFQWPPLHIVVAQQQLALTEQLLSQGQSPWDFNPNRQTAIEIAIKKQNFKLLDKLLKSKPVTSQKERNKLKNLLLFLVSESYSKKTSTIIQGIVKQAASLNMMSIINDALLLAIQTKNSAVTTQLLSINIIRIDKEHFLSSVPFATVKMMKQLLTKDVDLNWSDREGKSALIIASQNSNPKLVDYILSKNIKINHADDRGLTALLWSIKQDCNQCLTSLLNTNASTEIITESGHTALMLASINHPTSLEYLLSSPYELSQRNNHGLTALMIAVKNNCLKCAKLLLDAGANPRRKNKTGQDSHDLALTNEKLTELLDLY